MLLNRQRWWLSFYITLNHHFHQIHIMHTKTSPFPLFRLHHQLSSSLHHPLLRYVTALMVTSFSMLLLLSLPWAVLLKAFSIWKTLTGADRGSSDSLLSSLALRLNTTMQRQHGRQRQWTWHSAVSSKEVCASIKGGPNCKSYFFCLFSTADKFGVNS